MRITVDAAEKDIKSFSASERDSIKVLERCDGVTGCADCTLAAKFNAPGDIDPNHARKLDHIVIELSELKRDIQLNNSRQLRAGADLTVDYHYVAGWAELASERNPYLSNVLVDTDSVYKCVNCPDRFNAVITAVIEYEPEIN